MYQLFICSYANAECVFPFPAHTCCYEKYLPFLCLGYSKPLSSIFLSHIMILSTPALCFLLTVLWTMDYELGNKSVPSSAQIRSLPANGKCYQRDTCPMNTYFCAVQWKGMCLICKYCHAVESTSMGMFYEKM